MTIVHTALKVPYSSIVAQSIMLLDEAGASIAMLAVMNTDDPQGIADQVVAALNNRASRLAPDATESDWEEKHAGTSHYKEYKSLRYLMRRSFTSDFDF
mgnify:CR=1 FL=1